MKTHLMSEDVQNNYGQFRRKGKVFYRKTEKLISVRADIADTWFSIPATTASEHGFVSINTESGEFQFIPHMDQTQTPSDYRKSVKKAHA